MKATRGSGLLRLVLILALGQLLAACVARDGYQARLYVRTPHLARDEGWLSLREPLPEDNTSWVLRAVDFRGHDRFEFRVLRPTAIRIAASAKGQALDLSLLAPDGRVLFQSQASASHEVRYIGNQVLPIGSYYLELKASKRVDELQLVLQLDN